MKIRFHGRLADALGRELDIDLQAPCTIGRLRQRIAASFPLAAGLLGDHRVRACVRDRLVADDHRVAISDAVEFLPPVSGG